MRSGKVLAIVLIAILGVVVVVGGIIGVAFWATSGVVKAGDEFLGLIAQGKVAEAYRDHTSAGLKAAETEASFTAGIQKLGLAEFASSSWSSRQIENNVGTLVGSIKTKSGGTIPLKMQFVREQSKWKVTYCGPTTSAGVAATPPPTVPPQAELQALVTRTLLNFNQAIQTKDFGAFHATLAGPFQKQKSAQELKVAFQTFIDKEVDLAGIANSVPIFDPAPVINEDELLVVKGHYPTQPMRAHFDMKFMQENGIWRAMGVNVHVKPAP